ncbi:MAG: nucleoside deaminase [Anaerolineae bacterium]|nr:nucleoside deaminase [Anaerolineae bacterium]
MFTTIMDDTQFSEQDREYMSLALEEASRALEAGDYPVGAVLTVDGELWGQARNSILTGTQLDAHAEHKLLYMHSAELYGLIRSKQDHDVCLYTTLEPCLMCMGYTVFHRVSRVVVACPDPHGGATNIDPSRLGSFYVEIWPDVRMGLYKEASSDLIIEFLKMEKFISWEKMLADFTEMKRGWEKQP